MRIGKYTQDPDEKKRYTVDYDDWLDVGETLSNVTYVVTPTTAPVVVVSGSTIASDGRSVSFFVEDGADGTDYKVTVTATTSGSQIKEDNVLFVIRAQ
jgi:hypothetical protein